MSYTIRQSFKGTVVNLALRSLLGGSLEFKLTDPLMWIKNISCPTKC